MSEKFHPSIKGLLLKIIVGALVLGGVAFYFQRFLGSIFPFVLGTIALLAVLFALLAKVTLLFKTVEFEEETLKVTTGILNLKSVVIPYERIVNIESNQTLLQRILGLGTLEITSSGDKPEAVVPDISIAYLRSIIQAIEQRQGKK